MKFATKAVLLSNAASAFAFAPPRPHSAQKNNHQFQQQQQQQTTRQQKPTSSSSSALPLFPLDPSFSTTGLESSSILTSDLIEGLVSTVGSLALLGSVGFGVFSGMKDEDWDYEYKAGNEEAKLKYSSSGSGSSMNADLALIEVSPEEVAEDMVKAIEITAAQKSFFGKGEATNEVKSTPPPPSAPKKAEPVVPKTSDKVLKATEVARSEVTKKGVQETKEKMSSKSSSSTTASVAPAAAESKEVKEVKKDKGTKRKLVKGVSLIVAAGAVAVARNVVKAWLGRGML